MKLIMLRIGTRPMLGGSLVTTTWHVLKLRIEDTASTYWKSCRRQPTKCSPPAWGSSEGAKNSPP